MKLLPPFFLLVALSIAGCGSADEPSPPPGRNEVVMTEYEFTPRNLTVRSGVALTVRNEGEIAHNLTVEPSRTSGEKLIGTDSFLGGRSEKLKVDIPPGRYAMVCTVPGHLQLGMTGTLMVK
jgi:plastocyanin